MDAMVTARIPAEKKQRGNELLASLGKTPSRLISEIYDYVIEEGKLPDLTRSQKGEITSQERRQRFAEFINATVLPIPPSSWESEYADDGEALSAALEEKYGPVA